MSESEVLLGHLAIRVDALKNSLDHEVSEPWALQKDLDMVIEFMELYREAYFSERHDPKKGMALADD